MKTIFAIAIFSAFFSSSLLRADTLNVAAPSNLKALMTEISHFFEQKNPGWKVEDSYDNPSDLVDQIRGGTPLDVVIIDESNLKDVRQLTKIGPEQRLFSNEVVIVAQEETDLTWEDVKKSAIEDPEKLKKLALLGESTNLGKLTREYLKKIGIKNLPADKVVQASHPRGAVESVKNDEAKLAFLFGSDAARFKKLKILARLTSADIPGQVYYGAVLVESKNMKMAQAFLQTFGSNIVQQIVQNAGFTLPSAR